MIAFLNVKEVYFTCYILSCCFLTDSTAVKVNSKNYFEHFVFETDLLTSKSRNIEKISADAFDSVRYCIRFQIVDAKQLSTLLENLFYKKKAFQYLTEVDLRNTGITHLPEHLFRDLTELNTFYLYNSKLESLPPNLFQTNTKLRWVDLSDNRILNSIPPDFLKHNSKLSGILIQNNTLLKVLPPQLFPNLVRNDVRLQFSKNSLKFIEHKTFLNINFQNIVKIDISNNYLVCLPDYFLNVRKLSEYTRMNIDLRGNCFDESSQICELYNCNNKPAKDCEIVKAYTNIERCQQGYGRVTSQNYLNYFVSEENILYPTDQEIEEISSDAFDSVRNCKIFKLLHLTRLSALPENLFHNKKAFQNLNRLTFIDIGITNLPENLFRGLVQLERFDLYDTKLESLPANLFQSNTKLKFVAISNNKLLKSIPADLLKHNRRLYEISIGNNNLLNALPSQLFQYLNQKDLKLVFSRNNFKFIEPKTFDNINFESMGIMDISYNYLVCLPDYFLNVRKLSEHTRNKIDLTGNCFDESSYVCQLYNCNNRPDKQCEEARNSTNIKKCQQEYEETMDGKNQTRLLPWMRNMKFRIMKIFQWMKTQTRQLYHDMKSKIEAFFSGLLQRMKS